MTRRVTGEGDAPEDDLPAISGDQSARYLDEYSRRHLKTWPVGTSAGELLLAIPRTCNQDRKSLQARRNPGQKGWLPLAKERYQRMHLRLLTNLWRLRSRKQQRMIELSCQSTAMHRLCSFVLSASRPFLIIAKQPRRTELASNEGRSS